ncbi:MAG: sulfate reduction electron transfer complex DsrMKJOP subunit DsrM [Terriglobales bacterium]
MRNAAYSALAIAVLLLVAATADVNAAVRILVLIVIPYAAFALFAVGFAYRVWSWALAPVPFRIPTTCGQQKSLFWIRDAKLENPSRLPGVLGRMALETLLFRSLFRNTVANLHEGRLHFSEQKYLWLGALAFHWSLLVILLRHLRLLIEPVPAFVLAVDRVDAFFQFGTPELYVSDVVLACALVYLLARRLREPMLRYISQFSDYLALWLLLAVATSGLLMRYVTRVDVVAAKQFALSLASFHPQLPATLSTMFAVHVLLVSALAAYFPFSKLMHMAGAFLSPTRNLANNNRRQRHLNPWNSPVKTHSYAEWENEFRDKLIDAGIPLEAEHVTRATAD